MRTAVDTSVAVPLLVRPHAAHRTVVDWWAGRELVLTGHSLAETFAVLTRLPGALRLSAPDAASLLSARFSTTLLVDDETVRSVHTVLADAGISGGATYDGLVALAARSHGVVLATRDARARATYDALGVTTDIVA